ncbi:Probable flavin-containing monoamine oxidase C [Durusdinium trenchii]|uniref:monoamine oxidase n=1 Tax=Durusdinium trenchii TaxID=1381693 RepID=A0ABP0HQY9_9DINO
MAARTAQRVLAVALLVALRSCATAKFKNNDLPQICRGAFGQTSSCFESFAAQVSQVTGAVNASSPASVRRQCDLLGVVAGTMVETCFDDKPDCVRTLCGGGFDALPLIFEDAATLLGDPNCELEVACDDDDDEPGDDGSGATQQFVRNASIGGGVGGLVLASGLLLWLKFRRPPQTATAVVDLQPADVEAPILSLSCRRGFTAPIHQSFNSLELTERARTMSVLHDVAVVGGGLSGVVCAAKLVSELHVRSVVVLEAQDRLGGRLWAPDGLDLGAAWSWPANDKALGAVLRDLDVDRIDQHVDGVSLMETPGGDVVPMGSGESPSGPGSIRIQGGAGSICSRLAAKYDVDVRLESAVKSVKVVSSDTDAEAGDAVELRTATGTTVRAKTVVVAVPPRNAVHDISFEPPLEEERRKALAGVSTWMAGAGKVCLFFDKDNKFWRRAGLNGTFFSRVGPVVQGWDNSDADHAALCGFVFDADLKHLESEEALRASPILPQFERFFGKQVHDFSKLAFKTWAPHFPHDVATGRNQAATPFGHPLLAAPHRGVVFFASSETTPHQNGHMEGAVLAGIRSAHEAALRLRQCRA